jgi:hypothetical protein
MYFNYPDIEIDTTYKDLEAITKRRKPVFLCYQLRDLLGITDYPSIFETLDDRDLDSSIAHIHNTDHMEFGVVTVEGVRKLIKEVCPYPPEAKKTISEWFEKKVLPSIDQAWLEKVKAYCGEFETED